MLKRLTPLSPLMTGQVFKKKSQTSRQRGQQPSSHKASRDFYQHLNQVTLHFSQLVDNMFPNTNFRYSKESPSNHKEKVKLSFMLLVSFNLIQMHMQSHMAKAYKKSLISLLRSVPDNCTDRKRILKQILAVYKKLAQSMQLSHQFSEELSRLKKLGLRASTVDRHLHQKFYSKIFHAIDNLSQTMKKIKATLNRPSNKLTHCLQALSHIKKHFDSSRLSHTAASTK